MMLPGISSIQAALLGTALGVVIGGSGIGVVVHKVDNAHYEHLVAAQATAQRDAFGKALTMQKHIDADNAAASIAEAKAQERIVTQTITLTRKVPVYVTAKQDRDNCVTYGVVRVLVAAARGVDPASLDLPSGQSDDACTGLASSDLAATVAQAYGAGRQNAEQLDALIASIKANQDTASK